MLIELDLTPEVVQLLNYYRDQNSRSDFMNHMIVLFREGVRQPPKHRKEMSLNTIPLEPKTEYANVTRKHLRTTPRKIRR